MPEKGLDSLSAAIDAYEAQVSSALCLFYDNLGASSAPECQEAFQWSSYKKASQRCYSLCMEILSGISWGLYPAGAMLPSMNKMAEEKQVSVITIRRTLSLLGSIGVTKTVNGIGTYILPLGKVAGQLRLHPAHSQETAAGLCTEPAGVCPDLQEDYGNYSFPAG